jgi:hypothetical protein
MATSPLSRDVHNALAKAQKDLEWAVRMFHDSSTPEAVDIQILVNSIEDVLVAAKTQRCPKADEWISIDDGPDGAGAQVWVAYQNPNHPDGWNLRVQWTPVRNELAVEPMWWCPVVRPKTMPKSPDKEP